MGSLNRRNWLNEFLVSVGGSQLVKAVETNKDNQAKRTFGIVYPSKKTVLRAPIGSDVIFLRKQHYMTPEFPKHLLISAKSVEPR